MDTRDINPFRDSVQTDDVPMEWMVGPGAFEDSGGADDSGADQRWQKSVYHVVLVGDRDHYVTLSVDPEFAGRRLRTPRS